MVRSRKMEDTMDGGESTIKPGFVAPSRVGDKPFETVCPKCKKKVVTVVTFTKGAFSYMMACALSPLLCCCLPLLMDCFKDIVHTCPQCDEPIAMRDRGSL